MLFDDVFGDGESSDCLIGWVVNYFVQFVIDSFSNSIQAFMRLVAIFENFEKWGLVALIVAFAVFPYTLKIPIERWLFSDDEVDPEDAGSR